MKINFLKKYKNKFIIISISIVGHVVYRRKMGYKISKIRLSKNFETIS